MDITEEMYKEAQEIIKLYELQLRKRAIIKSIPTLEEGMILEYKSLSGWHEYTKDLQENIHFEPLATRVRRIQSQPSPVLNNLMVEVSKEKFGEIISQVPYKTSFVFGESIVRYEGKGRKFKNALFAEQNKEKYYVLSSLVS